ncbi:hypothetical protein ABZ329_31460 [Streptomyces rubiginosohelvolus]|uniref:hypothetical protein n=1 Tax=Streptomyces rubiginosohelvolus TaxID=67362 RepID=UPI0033EDE40E
MAASIAAARRPRGFRPSSTHPPTHPAQVVQEAGRLGSAKAARVCNVSGSAM